MNALTDWAGDQEAGPHLLLILRRQARGLLQTPQHLCQRLVFARADERSQLGEVELGVAPSLVSGLHNSKQMLVEEGGHQQLRSLETAGRQRPAPLTRACRPVFCREWNVAAGRRCARRLAG